ncbi:SpoIIE family protein phosphatase [Nonomuraea sp. NPDC050643]|uniref:SpoIIE family protein phosphatase n=1 Tax=Nonomuraea sp. NPDC050643 TaxID=3155660 RepID=UPI0033FDA825
MADIRDSDGPAEQVFERFLQGEQVDQSVRPAILRSWRRCQEFGRAPEKLGFTDPIELDPDSFLIRMARPILERAQHIVADANAALLLVDDQATLLLRYLSDPEMRRFFDKVQAVPGVGYSEDLLGTNGTGTALCEKRLFRVTAFEHPAPCVRPFTATGVPILDPLTGHARGAVSIVSPNEREDLAMSVLVQRLAQDIERRLLEHSNERERSLFEAFLRAGDLPCPVSAEDVGPFLRDLPQDDRFRLEEQATELIAHGQRAAVEVPLSRGRVAVLRSVPMTEPAGVVGVVAQVRIQGGPWERLSDVTLSEIPDLAPGHRRLTPPDAAEAAATGNGAGSSGSTNFVPAPRAESPVESQVPADPWLFLFGEPGVGRLAAAARRRIRLLYEVATNIGKTLDVTRTAEELAEMTVPRFADFVTVDLHECVLRGEEPSDQVDTDMCRVASRPDREDLFPVGVGDAVHYLPFSPQADCLLAQEAVLWPHPGTATAGDASLSSGNGIRSLIAVPLLAHDRVLGLATYMRLGASPPFEEDDVSLAEELVGRAAVCVDNARRFTRERATVLALQHSMLPGSLPEQSAVEVAHRHVPAQAAAHLGWFDVIRLPGTRVALVVGDVAGRGLQGVATMGRLRTAVGNFAALDLPPADILGHLDDLVRRFSQEEHEQAGSEESRLLRDFAARDAGSGVTGTTCVYAIYDPTSRRCTLASAGHPTPAVVHPGGAVEFLDLPPGEPLGLGGPPFETAEVELPEGSRLVLYTNGLLADDRESGPLTGTERLRLALERAGGTAEQTATSVLAAVPPGGLTDDATLLVARTCALEPGHIASWDLESDPAAVAGLRTEIARQLAAWDHEELAFTAELIFSELVTNAIRYGSEPIQARMILDRTLICEVSDASETSPRPRRACDTDEGGRGLFLVAQLAERWGTRYTRRGKVIWAEQPLTGDENEPSPAFSFFADDL